jgi:hypothetical protein
MSYNTAQWITLQEVVYQYIDQAQLTEGDFRRLWVAGVRGVEELGMDVYQMPKTVKLTVLPNKTVPLPTDYISYKRIGVFNSKGEIATLKHNPKLSTFGINSANRTEINTDDNSDLFRFKDLAYINYWDGGSYVNIFGLGHVLSNAGEFVVDEEQGVILLDNDYEKDYIVLEYMSSPSLDPDMKIPIQTREAVMSWISWKDIEFLPTSRKVNMSEKQVRRREYYNQKRVAKARINKFRTQDANEVIRMGSQFTVKG